MTRRCVPYCCLLVSVAAVAHTTRPVRLASDKQAVSGLLEGSKHYFVREVRPTSAEREAIRKTSGWTADEDVYRFYIGRNDHRRDVGAVAFLTEFTIHGPVRVAVALGPDGKVKGAMVVELSEETYPWVKPLIDHDFLRKFAGRGAHASFAEGAGGGSMRQFYGDIIAGLIRRAAILYEVTVLNRR